MGEADAIGELGAAEAMGDPDSDDEYGLGLPLGDDCEADDATVDDDAAAAMADTPMLDSAATPLPLAGRIFMPAAVGDCTGAFVMREPVVELPAAVSELLTVPAPLLARRAPEAVGVVAVPTGRLMVAEEPTAGDRRERLDGLGAPPVLTGVMVPSSGPPTVSFFSPALTDAAFGVSCEAALLLVEEGRPSVLLLRASGLLLLLTSGFTAFGLLITSREGQRRHTHQPTLREHTQEDGRWTGETAQRACGALKLSGGEGGGD